MNSKNTSLLKYALNLLPVLLVALLLAFGVACGVNGDPSRPNFALVDDLPNEVLRVIEDNFVERERVINNRAAVNADAVRGFFDHLRQNYDGLPESALAGYIERLGDDYEEARPGNVVRDLYRLVYADYPAIVDFVTDSDLITAAVRQMVAGLDDRYSSYLSPASAESFASRLTGRYEGIGARVGFNADMLLYITGFLGNSPAEEAGLQVNDAFIAVDGVDVTGLGQEEIIGLITGPAGEEVSLTVRREVAADAFDELTFEVERRSIAIEIVNTRVIEQDGMRFGVLELRSFNQLAVDAVLDGLCELTADAERCANYCTDNVCGVGDLDGLIFDLRANPGGLLSTTVEVASIFIDGNGEPALFERDQDGNFRDISIEGGTKYTDIPLIVLVGQSSASGAEVFAGALRDHGRAWISGMTTFGKGSINRQFNLSNGGAVYLTIRRWYAPCGELIENVGIVPQFAFETPEEAVQIFASANSPAPLCADFDTPSD